MKNYPYISLFVFLILWACQKDEEKTILPADAGRVECVVRLNAPNMENGLTRAVDENAIQSVYVLAFGKDNKLIEYQDATKVNGINQYKVKLPLGEMRLIFLANVNSEMLKTKINPGDSFSTVISQLTFQLKDATGGYWWGTNGIPMSYDTGTTLVTITADMKELSPHGNSINLQRSVAKVELINEDTHFRIESVSLYHAETGVQVIPQASGTVSVPSSGYGSNSNPQVLSGTNYLTYLAEQSNASSASHVCLLVKGKYNNGSTTCYRIDFVNPDGEHINIERNKYYKITIVSVQRDGESSLKDALDKGGVNASLNLKFQVETGDNNINYYSYNRDYYIGLEKLEMIFGNGSGSSEIYFDTNALNEVSVTVSPTAGTDWINATIDYQSKKIKIEVNQNKTGSDRKATLTFHAGTLAREIEVTQVNEEFAVFTDADLTTVYPLDGGSITFQAERRDIYKSLEDYPHVLYIKSLYPWRVLVTESAGEVMREMPQSGHEGVFQFNFTVFNPDFQKEGVTRSAQVDFYKLNSNSVWKTICIKSMSFKH